MLFLASGLVGAVLVQAPALAAQDLSCADFPNQEAAQREFDRYDRDVYGLDRNGNKIACEWISVAGRVLIEDSMDAVGAGRSLAGNVPGVTNGNPSGARAELRSLPALTGEQLRNSLGGPSKAGQQATRKAGEPAGAESWTSEEGDEVSGTGSVPNDLKPNELKPNELNQSANVDEPEQIIADDLSGATGVADQENVAALPHTGVPGRDTHLGLLAMTMLAAGGALLRSGRYRPRRLASRREG
jgi:hypothetical protein